MQNAIASVYGPKIDSDEYLKKFIDWRFGLPDPSAQAFAKFLCERFQISETGRFDGQNDYSILDVLALSFGLFAEGLGLSLRKQEQCFTQINLAVRSLNEKEIPFVNLLGCFAVLRSAYPEQYRSCCRGEESIQDFIYVLEPFMKEVKFSGFYGTWDEFKPIFHSWFLEEESAAKLQGENKILRDEYNKINAEGEHTAQKIKRIKQLETQCEYLSRAVSVFADLNRRFNLFHTPLAKITYRRLEGAGQFIED